MFKLFDLMDTLDLDMRLLILDTQVTHLNIHLMEHMAQIKTAFRSQIESCSSSLLVGIVGLGS